jgi:hypothetical protein
METILDQINGTFEAGFHYAAISIALSIPDICSTLELPPGAKAKASVKSRYIAWYNKYLASKYPEVRGMDLFALRNGVLHSGRMGHPDMQYDRIAFTTPDRGNNTFQLQVNDLLSLDARTFCQRMISAAQQWQIDHADDKNVIRNMPFLVQIRPDGLEPYIKGVPIIA